MPKSRKMIHPVTCPPSSLLGFPARLGIDAVQHFIIDILYFPEMHGKGQFCFHGYRGLQLLQVFQIKGCCRNLSARRSMAFLRAYSNPAPSSPSLTAALLPRGCG